MAITPAQALAEGRWPGLPELPSDDGLHEGLEDGLGVPAAFDADAFDEVEPEAAIDSELLERSLAGLLEAFEEVPVPQRAAVAVQIGQRLISCFGYQPETDRQLEARLRRAFQQQQRGSELMAARLGPDAAEKWIAELLAVDEDQWVASRIAERQRMREQCDGIEQMDASQRKSEAAAWWWRAADLGSLEGLNNWLGLAFFEAPVTSGNAVRVAEVKAQARDAIDVLLVRRYAPVLIHLMMFSAQGHFDRPSQSTTWIYGEAYHRIAARGPTAGWRLGRGAMSVEFQQFASELNRIAAEMDPAVRRDAEAWVEAIVRLPEPR